MYHIRSTDQTSVLKYHQNQQSPTTASSGDSSALQLSFKMPEISVTFRIHVCGVHKISHPIPANRITIELFWSRLPNYHRCANYEEEKTPAMFGWLSIQRNVSLLWNMNIWILFSMLGKQESRFSKETGVVSVRDLLLMDRHILLFNFSNNSKTLKGRFACFRQQ